MALYFEVDGIPVSVSDPKGTFNCAAWDTDPPRKFDHSSAFRTGVPVSEDMFLSLVKAVRESAKPSL